MQISMTSYGNRLKNLYNIIQWIIGFEHDLNLYVAKEDVLPEELTELANQIPNFKIWAVDDLKALKKVYYAVQQYPDDDILLIDDDFLYTQEWLRFAINNYIVHKSMFHDCVIGLVGYKILKNNTGKFELMTYGDTQNDWQKSLNYYSGHATPLYPSYKNILFSGGPGMFINSAQLHPDFYNLNIYNELKTINDELWIWAQSTRLGYKTVALNDASICPRNIESLLGATLHDINTAEYQNNYINKILDYYPDLYRLVELS